MKRKIPLEIIGISKEDQEKAFTVVAKHIEKLEDEFFLKTINKGGPMIK